MKKFYDIHNNEYTLADICAFIGTNLGSDVTGKIHIGTDSQKSGNLYNYVTVICLWGAGTGGNFFKRKTIKEDVAIRNLHHKLLTEVEFSVLLASELVNTHNIAYKDILIHVDVNAPTSKHASGRSADTLCKYVKAFGFDYVIKHDAWAASCVADHCTR